MEIAADSVWSIYSKLCEKATSWTNPRLDILEFGIRTICNYFPKRHRVGQWQYKRQVCALTDKQPESHSCYFSPSFLLLEVIAKFVHCSVTETHPAAGKLKRPSQKL